MLKFIINFILNTFILKFFKQCPTAYYFFKKTKIKKY